MTNSDLKNTTQKTKDQATRTLLNTFSGKVTSSCSTCGTRCQLPDINYNLLIWLSVSPFSCHQSIHNKLFVVFGIFLLNKSPIDSLVYVCFVLCFFESLLCTCSHQECRSIVLVWLAQPLLLSYYVFRSLVVSVTYQHF